MSPRSDSPSQLLPLLSFPDPISSRSLPPARDVWTSPCWNVYDRFLTEMNAVNHASYTFTSGTDGLEAFAT